MISTKVDNYDSNYDDDDDYKTKSFINNEFIKLDGSFMQMYFFRKKCGQCKFISIKNV